jgi:hypothetical protein
MAYVTKGQRADYDLVRSRIDNYFPDLVECQMTYGILLAHPSPDAPEKPVLLQNGVPVTGSVKKSSRDDRILGAVDVTLTLDAPHWANLDEEEQAAEVDHWLYRLQLQRDKKTKVFKTDDAHRPVFKFRPHDREVGVYDEIVRRHGRKAPESQAVEALSLHYQTLLPPDGNRRVAADPHAGVAVVETEDDAA